MNIDTIVEKLNSSPESVYLLIGGIVVLLLVLIAIAAILKKKKNRHSIPAIIKEISKDFLKDIALPDGLDGFIFIDYLVLTPTGILVIDVENYNGYLFGAENIDQWTQMIGHKSYKFNNPLPQHEHNIRSVRSYTGKVPVKGRLVFSSEGSFPKGIPGGVSTADSFKDDVAIEVMGNAVPEIYQQVWKELGDMAKDAARQLAGQK